MAVPDNIDSRGSGPADGEPREAPDTLRHRDPVPDGQAADGTPVTVGQRAAEDTRLDDGQVGGAGGPTDRVPGEVAHARGDRSPWNWLLIIPIVVPLLTPLFNSTDPVLWGFPRFYWLQLAFIILGVTVTTIVYQATKRRG